MTNALALVYM